MNIRKIKTLYPAPESSVTYYMTSTVNSVAADATGAVINPQQEIVITEWMRKGSESAVVSSDMHMTLFAVRNGVKTAFGQSDWAPQASFLASVLNGQDCIVAELTDSSQHVVCSMSIPVIKQGQPGTPGGDGDNGKDGEDGTSYEIVPSVSCIRKDGAGKVTTGAITIKAFCHKGNTRTQVIAESHIVTVDSTAWRAQYSKDGNDWTFFSTKVNTIAGTFSYQVPASSVSTTVSGIAFRLVYGTHASYDIMHETAPIPVVSDGADGAQGKAGRMYWFAGYWQDGNVYTSNDYEAPFVAYEYNEVLNGVDVLVTRYYMLVADTNVVGGVAVAPRSTEASGVWAEMEQSFRYLISEAFFTNFAKLGKAIFSGDWMISQQGSITHEISDLDRSNLSEVLDVFTIEQLAAMYLPDGTYDTYELSGEFPDMTESEMTDLIDICLWAMETGITDSELPNVGDESYQLFGRVSDDVMAAFRPRVAIDFVAGKAYMDNAEIYGFLGKQKRTITKTNMSSFMETYLGYSYVSLRKAGTYLSFEGSGFAPNVLLPSLSSLGTKYNMPVVRTMVGTDVLIYCKANANMSIEGLLYDTDGNKRTGTVLYYGYMAALKCVVKADTEGREEIGWEYVIMKYI